MAKNWKNNNIIMSILKIDFRVETPSSVVDSNIDIEYNIDNLQAI